MSGSQAERVRALVRRWGWNVTSYQILNRGFSFWFDDTLDAVVGFIESAGVRVVGGGPVCAPGKMRAAIDGFEAAARARGLGTVYFGVEQRFTRSIAADAGRTTFSIGAQPLWTPGALLHEFDTHRSLRAQLHRARNKHVEVRHVPEREPALLDALRRVLAEWMQSRGLPPLHFLVETDSLDQLADRHLFVAERAGEVVGFLILTPVPARDGWLVEHIMRGRHAPNGTAELLFAQSARFLQQEGASLVTLGLAPLAARASSPTENAPYWLRLLLSALRAHGRRFYNFAGLEAFKAKFGGAAWEPVYASIAPGTTVARALLGITRAFSGEALPVFAAHAAGHAVARSFHRRSG